MKRLMLLLLLCCAAQASAADFSGLWTNTRLPRMPLSRLDLDYPAIPAYLRRQDNIGVYLKSEKAIAAEPIEIQALARVGGSAIAAAGAFQSNSTAEQAGFAAIAVFNAVKLLALPNSGAKKGHWDFIFSQNK